MNKFDAKDIEINGKVYAVTKDGGIFMHSYTDQAGKIRKNKWVTHKVHPKTGRLMVGLNSLTGTRHTFYVHQVVMMAWGTPAPEGMEQPTIDHINNDKLNNHIDNLQWMSHSDNVKKMWEAKTDEEKALMANGASERFKEMHRNKDSRFKAYKN